MGRVPVTRSRPGSVAPGALRHKEQANNSKPGYKVVVEEITQKKKNLVTLVRRLIREKCTHLINSF
jgi:hypothetical protein